MKTKLSLVCMIAVTVFLVNGPLHAGKDKEGKRPELKDLNLAGKVVSEQVEKKGKDGSSKTITAYYLSTDDAKIYLPPPESKKKGELPPFQLSTFVDASVRISAKGFIRSSKKGGVSTHVHQIVNIERVTN